MSNAPPLRWLAVAVFAFVVAQCLAESGAHVNPNYNINRECNHIHEINDPAEQCYFSNVTLDCDIGSGHINYVTEFYCTFYSPVSRGFAYVLFALWFAYLLLSMAVISDRVFVPDLQAMADALHLSQNVAGETLLPLGNGAADIFTSIAAATTMRGGDISVLMGTLLGSGGYTTTFIVGTIIMLKPFGTMQRPLLRLIIFYLLAVGTAYIITYDGVVDWIDASIFLLYYAVYLATVILGTKINKLIIKRLVKRHKLVAAGKKRASHADYLAGFAKVQAKNDSLTPKPSAIPEIVISGCDEERPSEGDVVSPTVSSTRASGSLRFNTPEKLAEVNAWQDKSPIATPMRSKAFSIASPSVEQIQGAIEKAAATAAADRREKPRSSSVHEQPVNVERSDSHPHHHHRHHHHFHVEPEERPILTRTARLLIREGSRLDESNRVLRKRFRAATSTGDHNKLFTPVEAILLPSLSPSMNDIREEDEEDIDVVKEEFEMESMPSRRSSFSAKISEMVSSWSSGRSIFSETSQPDRVVEDKPMWRWMVDGLNPINWEDWPNATWYWKVMQIIKAPILFLVLFTTPVVDEEKPMYNWNRYLDVTHCLIAPVFLMLALRLQSMMIGGVFPVIAIAAIVGAIFAVIVFFTTKNTERPKYHIAFAVLGFLTTAMWIYFFANEIVNLINFFGLTLYIDESVLGITFLAWGNSLPDLLNNTTIARQGFRKMAISSCFGSAVFNILIGLGLPLMIIALNNGGSVSVYLPNIVSLMFLYVLVMTSFSLVAIVIVQNFYVRRPYAAVTMTAYVCLLVIIILIEFGVIPFTELRF